jgi:hypothetical protein
MIHVFFRFINNLINIKLKMDEAEDYYYEIIFSKRSIYREKKSIK